MHWNRLRLAEDLNQTDKTDVYRLCRSILSRNETMRLDNKENKLLWHGTKIEFMLSQHDGETILPLDHGQILNSYSPWSVYWSSPNF